MDGTCSAYGGEKRLFRVLVGKPKGNRLLGRPRRKWEDNIKMDLQKVRCRSMDWLELAQYREMWWALENAVMNLSGSIKCGEFLDWLKTS